MASSLLDQARDELFSHINRCGVLHASPEDQKTWMGETVDYIAERYPDLGDSDLHALHGIGLRFCQPAIAHGADSTARSRGEATDGAAEVATDEAAETATDEAAENPSEGAVTAEATEIGSDVSTDEAVEEGAEEATVA